MALMHTAWQRVLLHETVCAHMPNRLNTHYYYWATLHMVCSYAMSGQLSSIEGPFFGGAQFDATDAALAPKLYHAVVGLGHYR